MANSPPVKKVMIYLGVDPKLESAQKTDLRAAGQYVKEQLSVVFQDLADVEVQCVDDWGRMKSLKGDRSTKLVYGMGSRSADEFKQVFTDHRETLVDETAIQLARRGNVGLEGQAAGAAAGTSGDSVVAVVAVAKVPYLNLLKNRLLHETAHLLGLKHLDSSRNLMKPAIGATEALLPLTPGQVRVMRIVQSQP